MKTIIMIIALAFSYLPSQQITTKLNPKQSINYYWFNSSGTYLRQNTLLVEHTLTGYDNNPAAPVTVRERGYAPANCSGSNPPIPNDPDSPDQILYSHP